MDGLETPPTIFGNTTYICIHIHEFGFSVRYFSCKNSRGAIYYIYVHSARQGSTQQQQQHGKAGETHDTYTYIRNSIRIHSCTTVFPSMPLFARAITGRCTPRQHSSGNAAGAVPGATIPLLLLLRGNIRALVAIRTSFHQQI